MLFPCVRQAKTGYRKKYVFVKIYFSIYIVGVSPKRKKEKIVNCALHGRPLFTIDFLHCFTFPLERERDWALRPENRLKMQVDKHLPNAHLNAHKCPKRPKCP
jgi:hypothetical protein